MWGAIGIATGTKTRIMTERVPIKARILSDRVQKGKDYDREGSIKGRLMSERG